MYTWMEEELQKLSGPYLFTAICSRKFSLGRSLHPSWRCVLAVEWWIFLSTEVAVLLPRPQETVCSGVKASIAFVRIITTSSTHNFKHDTTFCFKILSKLICWRDFCSLLRLENLWLSPSTTMKRYRLDPPSHVSNRSLSLNIFLLPLSQRLQRS